jgi:hypothetical protein
MGLELKKAAAQEIVSQSRDLREAYDASEPLIDAICNCFNGASLFIWVKNMGVTRLCYLAGAYATLESLLNTEYVSTRKQVNTSLGKW